MSILFSCNCGKAMKAKEEYAGRKVKCPQCASVVRIPQADVSQSRPTDTLLAKPVLARRQEHHAEPAPASVNTWVDQSLSQCTTPWLPGDEVRFQKGIKTPSEGIGGSVKGMLVVLVLAATGAAGWLLTKIF